MNISERNGIDSEQLRAFLAVAETGNVTRAGSVLGRTQSAVSVQLRNLEEALSVRLFERRARGMELTEEGYRLLPAAGRALAEIGRIGDLFNAPLTGRIRVGIPDDYGVAALEQVLAAFAERHSGVEVSVRCSFSAGFPEAIRANELDLAVYTAEPGCAAEPLASEATVWAAATTFALREDAAVPLALFDRACWWRDAAIAALERVGMPYRIAYSSESVAGIKAAIGAGLAVGVLNAGTLDRSLRALTEADGFPALPPSSLVLLRRAGLDSALAGEMERAIRAALASPS